MYFTFHRTLSAARDRAGVQAFITLFLLVLLLSVITVSRAGLGPPSPQEKPGAQIPDSTARAPAGTGTKPATPAAPGLADTSRADSLLQSRAKGSGGDTAYVVYLDSTARLAQFSRVRRDRPAVTLFPRRSYPLFATPRVGGVRREVTIDSATSEVRARETLGGVDLRHPVSIPLQEYITLRRKEELRKMLADEVQTVKAAQKKDDLGELLSTITQIQIPIPPNPIFSIFGKPEIRLNVTGSVDIKAGFRNTKADYTTISSLDQSRNEPDFSQDVQVNVSGTIGDKLNILADWNTKRTFEYENQLKIKYTGYDDEIVQSVEAGNVSLTTPSSFIGSSQALFGVKAKFQTGPLTLTTLASQKKGQIKEVAVSGGAKEQTFEFRPYEYATNNYFVDTSYISTYEPYYQNDPPLVDGERQIIEEEVWVQRQGSKPDENERQAICFITLPPRGSQGYNEALRSAPEFPGAVEVGPMVRLDRAQYELSGDGYIGVLSLNANVGDQQIVGVAYRVTGGQQYGELIRDLGTDSAAVQKKLILKMVKPKNLLANGPSYRIAWKQLLKNIYPIPGIGRNLKESGFGLKVFRKIPGGENQELILNEPLLRVLGLDRYNVDGTASENGDGMFDFRPGRTVNQSRAEIVFPRLRPFDDGIRNYFAAKGTILEDTSEYLYREIYDTTVTFAQQSLRNRYVISGKATGEATSKYSLGFNVVEGSVQVILDGRQLVQNVDYTVDYIIGEVVIRNERALVPGANLQIKYEQNDLFQLASKTLLGARGDISISPKTNFGFTIMNLNQETLSDKVRIGEEPNKNTILGVDGTTTLELPFLTRAIDALPLLETREMSSIKLSGEAAYMIPDPNTKKSTIPSDEGEGMAFIDDFEGVRRTIPIGISYTAWYPASIPADDYWFPVLDADTARMNAKAKLTWFNIPNSVRLTDVYPRKEVGNNQNNQATPLDLRYYPTTRGMFNTSLDLENTVRPAQNWGGIMKPLSISAINLTKENINFIEIWMRIDRAPADGSAKMVIDLGVVSEDAIPNRTLNSEDLVVSSSPNGTLQEGEDVGLDMLTDAQEQQRYAALIARYPELAADPSGDNYAFSNNSATEDYLRINGSQGNINGPGGRIPDTEDLNSNGIVDLANSYAQYIVPLDTTPGNNPYIVGGGSNFWYQYRIPIGDVMRVVGRPTQENVEFIRVSFINVTDTVAVRIIDFNLVGNQWQKLRRDITDSTFDVSVVNIEDNPNYQSPPGVIRERDKTRPDEKVLANEQSLSLVLNELPDGESRQAVKFYTYRALDIFNYRAMKMFVWGDSSFQYLDPANYDAEIFFRFGLDSLNFYEYRAPLHKGWDGRNEVIVKFDQLTAIKQRRDSANTITPPVPVEGGPPGSAYRVLGNPSLTQIVYLAVGVENPAGKGTIAPLRGQVWFNELRVVGVDDSPGWAYRLDAQAKLADFASVSFNYSQVDPWFHSLEQRFGSRSQSTNWGMSASAQLERLFPDDWSGTSLPVSYTHTETFQEPRYLPNSDVLVTEAAEQTRQKVIDGGGTQQEADEQSSNTIAQTQSQRVAETYAAPTLRIALPTKWWLIRDTFNKLTYGFTYTRSTERSPALVSRTAWSWNVSLRYALSIPPDYALTPLKVVLEGGLLDEYKTLKIGLLPSQFQWNVSAIRGRDNSLQRIAGAREITTRNFSSSRGFGFSWKFLENAPIDFGDDYSLSIESTLLNLETDSTGAQRPFSAILGDIFGGSRLIDFGEDIRYSQRNQFGLKPNIPNIFNVRRYLDLNFSYAADYSWTNSLTRGDVGKTASATGSVNFSMNFRLKQLFDPLWEDTPQQAQQQPRGRRGTETGEAPAAQPDTSARPAGPSMSLLGRLKWLTRVLIKVPFLDYDNITVTFNQSNSSQNNGVVGGTGFANFWGRLPFQDPLPEYGPSRLYQLGLISDPSGTLSNFRFNGVPPFFHWDVEPGVRAPGAVLINTYRQTNRMGLKTSRGLWEGAKIDLSWNLGWTYNRTQNIISDSLTGAVRVQTSTTTGSIERSFMSFPDLLVFGLFNTGIEAVGKKYGELKADQSDTRSDEEKLSQAFVEGMEALPWLQEIFGQYYPRVNWSFRWDGLEKISLFSGFVSRLSFDHAYTSSYSRQYQNRQGGGGERTDGQRVSYGFSPLAGLNFTFKELLKGNFGANFRFTTTSSYDLTGSSRNIVEAISQEISITASYNRRGFEIPLFGIALSNDVDISFSYSITKNSRKTYDIATLDRGAKGVPVEGTTRTLMEPRIRYVLSSRVSASVYYRYTKIAPDDFGSRIPGSTVNEAGLDLRISIQ